MKSLINLRTGAMMLMLILLSGTSAWADVDDYLLSVRNVSHTTNTIDFDLYLLDADNAQTFEFAALQMGLLLNSSIYGSGILTVSYSNTGSGLDGDQQFVFAPDAVAPLAGYAGKTLIRLMPNSIPPVPPGAGSGTVISSGGYGTLLAHFTITSSVSFTPNSRAGMEFCAGTAVSPLFPTVVYSYIEGNSTALPVTPGIDAIVDGDPLLNATPPALFNVTGTGDYCEGGAGLPVGLSGSELNTTYTLYRDAVVVTTIPGTGSTLTFGIQTEGTYTVFAINAASTVQMTGQAVITAVINTVSPPSSTPTLCINTALTAITHATTGATGIGAATGLPSGVSAAWAANTITISGTPSVAGTFNYSIPLTGGCGIINATGTITVTPANTVTLTSAVGTNNQTVCSGTAITNITYSTTGATGATVTGLPTGVTGNWSGGIVTINGTPTATGTFGYTVTLTGGCGAITASGNINVNALPVTSVITGSATPACSAQGVPYSVTSTPGSTYTWTVPTGATVASGQGTNSITVNFGTTNGNVAVTERNSAGCYGTTVTRAISLQGCGLIANFEGTPLSICVGSSVTFTNTSTGVSPTTSYSWNFGSGATPSSITGIGPHTVTYSTTGPKTISLTITEGASNTETKTGYITVNPINTVNRTSGAGTDNQTVCVNTAISNITYSTTGATGATFSGFPAGLTMGWSSNVVTISGTPSTAGTFNYTVTLTGGCGIVNATGTITVTPANTVTLTSAVGTNNQTVCSGTAITNITYSTTGATGATVTGLPTGVTGNWSGGVVTINGTPTATGTFGYTVTLTGGCGAITASGNLNVNALPVTSAITGSATPACSATGVPYSVVSTSGSTYTWTVPTGATVASGQGTNSITVNFGTTNGNVAVTERNSAGCYGTTVTRTISLQGCGLSADFSATPRSVCIGSTVSFSNLSTGTSGGTVYNWNFGSGANPLTTTGPGPHSVTYSTSGSKDVTLTITEGASDVETKVGYITVNPANTISLTSAIGTNNQTICVNTAISNITYSTTGATGATFSGLPTGVNAIWSANIVTISGTPNIQGTFNYIVTLTGGCGNITANGTITVNACLKTLTLSSVLLQGLYNGSGMMRQAQNSSGAQWPVGVADHITVELHDATNYSNIVWSATDVPLSTTGSAIISVPPAYSGTYYITIRHRNSIETTTSTAVSFAGSSIARSFALRTSVFGSNLGASGDGYYVIYGADVNQDGIVDTGDMNDVDNGSAAILIGYNLPDANGDGLVDTSDMNMVDNNSAAVVFIRIPF